MSQPKREPINRYRPLTQGEARALGGGLMRVPTKEEANKGDYVEYSEYQQLAADHAALVQQGIRDHADWRSKLNFLEADYKAEIARLTAENERLRKAGDAMYDFAVQDSLGYWVMPPFQRWGKEHHSRNAAKEGGAK